MRPHAKTTILSLLVVALFLQAAPAGAQRRAAATNRTEAAVNNSNATSRALQKLLDDEWEWTMRENPTFASTLGDRRYNDRWEDASLESVERQYQHRLETLKRLQTIPRAQLSTADQLNYDLFKKDLDNDIEGHKFKLYLPEAERARHAQPAREAVAQNVIPAYRQLKDYFTKEYLPASPEQVGVWQWPDGAQAYAFLARRYTTTTMTPEQIHKRGLQEV